MLISVASLVAMACTDPLPPDTLQRTIFDNAIAQAQMQTTIILYDNHIAGKLTGNIDIQVSCPDGGSSRITGTVVPAASDGLTNIDLTFAMNACYAVLSGASGDRTSLRTTGILRKTASFSASAATASYQSSGNLAVSGTLRHVINSRTHLEPSIDESCAFAATATRTQATGSYCGRPFSF